MESHDNSHEIPVGGDRSSPDVTDTKYTGNVEVNSISEVAEHDDHACADYASHDVSGIKTYQRKNEVISSSSKRRKVSDSVVNCLEPNKEGTSSSVLVVQNRRQNTNMDSSDEALASGCLENMLEREVVVGHEISSEVMEDILVEKRLGGCSDIEHASGESKNRIEMEKPRETINEAGFASDLSVADFAGEYLEQPKSTKLNVNQNAVCGVYSSEQLEEFTRNFKEENASGDASGEDPSTAPLDQKRLSKMEDAIPSLSDLDQLRENVKVIDQENHPTHMLQSSLKRALTGCSRRKLLVLDVNGLIADIVSDVTDGYEPDTYIGRKAVFKRPFCDDFLQFCFERFNVGVWTSRTKRNVQLVLDFIMGKTRQNLLFCWDQSHCTETGFNTVENRDKPLFLKELKKLWEKHEPNLPWERGEYNESNTLLLDDSPYKALRNPPHTAIFPRSYQYTDEKDDSLGPGGDLRSYLEGLALAENVQKYVAKNPYGQRSITETNLSWQFYLKVLGTSSSQLEDDANNSDLEHANGGNKMKIEMEKSKETINEDNFAKHVSLADHAGENFEQAKSCKLNISQNAECDVYSAEQQLEEFARCCKDDKASGDAFDQNPLTEPLEQRRQSKMGDTISSLSEFDDMKGHVTQVVNNENHRPQMLRSSLGRAVTGCFRRKLLVLDVRLISDIVSYVPYGYKADAIIGRRAVFKRPFCDDFLQFCFERFNIGLWSSKPRVGVESVLDFLMGNTRHNLLFCWNLSHCTWTGFNTVERRDKPLVLKELKKLWEKHDPYLPWERGEYNESNTLLVDDAPHKALRNPPNTAIFPHAYVYKDENDNSLGPGGDLRVYLEGLALAENVQTYVEQNPFGQRPITKTNLSWRFYLKVIGPTSSQLEDDANYSSGNPSRREDDANNPPPC